MQSFKNAQADSRQPPRVWRRSGLWSPCSAWMALSLLAVATAAGQGALDPAESVMRAGPLELHVGVGHSDGINSVAFSPDGRMLVTGSADNTVKFWDVATGSEVRTLRGHNRPVQSVAFYPSGELLMDSRGQLFARRRSANGVSVSAIGGNTTWKMPPGDAMERDVLASAVLVPSGRVLVTACQGSLVCFWDVQTGKRLAVLNVGQTYLNVNVGWLESLAVSPKGLRIATADQDVLKIADLSNDEGGRKFSAHSDKITSVAFSPDGKVLATASWDATVKLWDAETGRNLQTLKGHKFWVESVAFSPDGRFVASASRDGTARLWDVPTGRQVALIQTDDAGTAMAIEQMVSVAFSPDGRLLAAGTSLGNVRLFDIQAGKVSRVLKGLLWSMRDDGPLPGPAHKRDVRSLAFSPDSRMLATGGTDKTVRLWDVATGQVVHTLGGRSETPQAVAFSPDGRCLAVGAWDETVRLWDPTTGCLTATLAGYSGPVRAVAFSPDGRWLASADHEVRLRDMPAGSEARVLKSRLSAMGSWRSLAFSPDSHLIAGISDRVLSAQRRYVNIVSVWDAAAGQTVRTLDIPTAQDYGNAAIAFSPNGRWLVTLTRTEVQQAADVEKKALQALQREAKSPRVLGKVPELDEMARQWTCQLKVWDIETWREFRTLSLEGTDAEAVAFTPDGEQLIVGARTVWIVNVADWRPVGRIGGSHGTVAASPDGRFLAACNDASVALLRRPGPQQVFEQSAVLKGHDSDIESLAFRSDGRVLASASSDNTVKLWDVERGQLMATLVARRDGGWATFLPGNCYRASVGALDAVVFTAGTRAYPFEQFDLIFNRPDLVMQRLGCTDRIRIQAAERARQRRLARMGLKEEDLRLDLDLPNVEIDRNSLAHVSRERRVSLKVRAWDKANLLDRLVVWVNEVPTPGSESLLLRGRKVRETECEIPLELSTGVNKIQVAVLNEKGAASPKDTVYVRCDADGKPDLWLITIGVSHYQNPAYNLRLAAKDAEDLASVGSRDPLQKDIERRFGKVHVLTLWDADATRARILDAAKFLAPSKVDDVAIVFAAGHGLLDEHATYYFGTYDVDHQKPADRGLAFDELHALFKDVPARNKLLLLDTCHAGEFGRGPAAPVATQVDLAGARSEDVPAASAVMVRALSARRGIGGSRPLDKARSFAEISEESLFADLRRETGASVIAACSGDEYSIEGSRWKNGVFTYSVLECLQTCRGDTDGDGKIRVSELWDYVAARVKELTSGGQNPTERRQNPANDFVVFELMPVTVQIGPPDMPLSYTFSAAVSSDGKYLLAGQRDGISRLWEITTGRLVKEFPGHQGGVFRVVFSPDGRAALMENGMGVAMLRDVETGRVLKTFKGRNVAEPAKTPSSETAAGGALEAPQGTVSRTKEGAGKATSRRFTGPAADFWAAGDGIVVLVEDDVVRFVDPSTDREARRVGPHPGGISATAFSSDGRRLLTGGNDGSVILWDVATGQVVRKFKASGTAAIETAALTNGPGHVFAAGRGFATLWDEKTGSVVKEFSPGSNPAKATFSPNGRRVLLEDDAPGSLRLLDTQSGSVISILGTQDKGVLCFAFSADGKRILTGGQDRIARLWSAENGRPLRMLTGHREMLLSVAFLPDGRWCVTVGCDNTAKLWYIGEAD